MGKGKHFRNSKCSDTGCVRFPYQSVPGFYVDNQVCVLQFSIFWHSYPELTQTPEIKGPDH